jgi:glycosyltransferase involved in cell wall biosynthesis
MKIVHCATTHRTTDPRIFQKECRTLAEAGYEVVYVVPHDRDEVVEGIQIRAVPRPETGRQRLTETTRAVYDRALEEGPEATIHLHDSDLLLMGFRLKGAGRRVVYDAHEDTPRQMRYQHWIPRWLRPAAGLVAGALETAGGRMFDGVIAAVPEIARRFPEGKTAIVRNYPILEELTAEDALPYTERPPLACYVGSITRVRGVSEMVSAVQSLPEGLGAELLLGGPFYPAGLREEVGEPERVHVTGYLSRPEVAHWLGRSRVGLVVLHPVGQYLESYPTKLFEYMAAGLPVIASDFPVWKAIVDEAGCGLTVDPYDVGALAEALEWMLTHPSEAEAMGERGRAAVRERYSWAGEGEALVSFYHRLIGPPRG